MADTNTTTEAPATDGVRGVPIDTALMLLRQMLLYRRFEEKAEEAYAIGRIGGFCHLHIGQEAAAAGTILALAPDDYVISAYREHTQALARGMDPNVVMAELFGRADGCAGGKGAANGESSCSRSSWCCSSNPACGAWSKHAQILRSKRSRKRCSPRRMKRPRMKKRLMWSNARR